MLKKTTVLLSVGLAPGISNLLAKNSLNSLVSSRKVDLYILLGLGEKHGDAAYRWTFNNIHNTYSISRNSVSTSVKSFSNPEKTNLEGTRTFYTFNFSDQHILYRTTQADEVLTRFAFDSRFLTLVIGLLRKYGITKIFENIYFQKLLLYTFKNFTVGTDVFAVKAVAKHKDRFYESKIAGNRESEITAYMTVISALELLKETSKPGVYHLHEVISDIPQFLNQLKKYDSSIKIELLTKIFINRSQVPLLSKPL